VTRIYAYTRTDDVVSLTDPYKWTVEQVQKWTRWTLSQYNLYEGFADNFWLDGTSLCMLSKQDMVCRSAHAGEYLYAELDIWKNGEFTLCDGVNDLR